MSFLVMQPRATLKFPLGEVSFEEREEDEKEEHKRTLSVNGIVKSHILNGVCTAQYHEENLNLRYAYKVGSSLCPFQKGYYSFFLFLLTLAKIYYHGLFD